MKRDMELIRRLLLEAEEDRPVRKRPELGAPELVGGHVKLLGDAGLVEVIDYSTRGAPCDYEICRLTWAGHEFLDAARNNSSWNKVLTSLRESAVSVTFSVLQQLLVQELKRRVGLD